MHNSGVTASSRRLVAALLTCRRCPTPPGHWHDWGPRRRPACGAAAGWGRWRRQASRCCRWVWPCTQWLAELVWTFVDVSRDQHAPAPPSAAGTHMPHGHSQHAHMCPPVSNTRAHPRACVLAGVPHSGAVQPAVGDGGVSPSTAGALAGGGAGAAGGAGGGTGAAGAAAGCVRRAGRRGL